MTFLSKHFLILLLLTANIVSAQKIKKADRAVLSNLHQHIEYLASDKLEGRRTGTAGEKLAMEYISNQFKTIGLLPKGNDGYYQPFGVDDGKQLDPASFLSINKNQLVPEKDFFAFSFSPNGTIETSPAVAIKEIGMPWFIDLKETLEENKNNPHFDPFDFIKKTVKDSKKSGATAVFFYNTSAIDDQIKYNPKDHSETLPIPAIYITQTAAVKYLGDPSATLDLRMKINLVEKSRTGHNVIGYIDNGAATTVILGAHFDHLGYGEDGGSRLTTGQHLIHNGADDNASGTAALIELARMLKSSKDKSNNYLFIAFSGEELGLFGSKYFTDHPTIDLDKADYMINMDMVGRLNDSTHVITIGGYGTSPEWSAVFASFNKKKADLIFKYDSSGTGPSDHTSFYRKDIPVLFYFTGLHPDYHKPTDDFDKINYTGELKVIKNIISVIDFLNNKNKLVFTKTREEQTGTSAKFKVTLGIMPDYTYPGAGVRADGIIDDRPAQKAGLKAGDIIIQLGDYNISTLENYMQALGKFVKGEKTKVKFKRGNEMMEAEVEF
ncbi:MAG: M20/M25/M40 family metallo-hydrolase [Bacteroidetes bacterium]|nr:M20/M25/M40 family metallo-hydrolase [Bacteroidota bacterium]MBS1929876.1 M20/M25/M40 family metallo-hydrolase [Bacteroidota bacterium]